MYVYSTANVILINIIKNKLRSFLFQIVEDPSFKKLIENMTVDKDDTAEAKRRKVSAQDDREGSVASGGVALFFLIAAGSLFVIIDMSRLFPLISKIFKTKQRNNESHAWT